MWVFPLGAAAVSFVFAALLLKSWWARRCAHSMAWAIALTMFGLASLAAAAGMLGAWTASWFRVYYLFGAVVNVPVLGLGPSTCLPARELGCGVELWWLW